jgi:hypothetical protein
MKQGKIYYDENKILLPMDYRIIKCAICLIVEDLLIIYMPVYKDHRKHYEIIHCMMTLDENNKQQIIDDINNNKLIINNYFYKSSDIYESFELMFKQLIKQLNIYSKDIDSWNIIFNFLYYPIVQNYGHDNYDKLFSTGIIPESFTMCSIDYFNALYCKNQKMLLFNNHPMNIDKPVYIEINGKLNSFKELFPFNNVLESFIIDLATNDVGAVINISNALSI